MYSRRRTGMDKWIGTCALLVALGSATCDSLTDVNATDIVGPASLANANGAATLYAGAVGSFTDAFAVGSRSQMISTGLVSDEFFSGHPVSVWSDYDFRVFPEPGEAQPYTDLQKARISGLQAIGPLQEFAPSPPARIGEVFAYIGYIETFLGENMCSGIPLGALVNDEPVLGEPLTTAQMLERSVASFDSATSYAVDDTRIANLAMVGRGRALLNLGRFGDAAAAVAAVPTTFSFATSHSTALQINGYYTAGFVSRGAVVADREGTNGLDFRSANDPRVPWRAAGKGNDSIVDHFQFMRYSSPSSPVVLASGVEARLIETEAAYHANPDNSSPAGTGWLGILNSLRATMINPPLIPLSDPGSRAAREDLIFRERAFWLYGTGHRHGDMRRLVRQYGRDAESVFPTGFNRPGIPYGTDVNLAPPATQRNNPSYNGCLDRNA